MPGAEEPECDHEWTFASSNGNWQRCPRCRATRQSPDSVSGSLVNMDYSEIEGRVLAFMTGAQSAYPEPRPLPIETAPKDGTFIRLLVKFTEHPLEDADENTPVWTIGFNNEDNTLERPDWHFAGWCWSHDHFTEGAGTPIGWLPFHG